MLTISAEIFTYKLYNVLSHNGVVVTISLVSLADAKR